MTALPLSLGEEDGRASGWSGRAGRPPQMPSVGGHGQRLKCNGKLLPFLCVRRGRVKALDLGLLVVGMRFYRSICRLLNFSAQALMIDLVSYFESTPGVGSPIPNGLLGNPGE